jgi:hypothetical protein
MVPDDLKSIAMKAREIRPLLQRIVDECDPARLTAYEPWLDAPEMLRRVVSDCLNHQYLTSGIKDQVVQAENALQEFERLLDQLIADWNSRQRVLPRIKGSATRLQVALARLPKGYVLP